MLPTPVFLGFLCGSGGKESACSAGDLGWIAGLGTSPGEGKGYPLQYSGLENSMDCIVHGLQRVEQTERFSLSLSLDLMTPFKPVFYFMTPLPLSLKE